MTAVLVSARPARLRIAASHDPLLIEALATRADLEIAVMGSDAALDRLATGATDVAGCHFGAAESSGHQLPALLRDRAYVAHPVFAREQGLILATGNPLGIRSIADLARSRARFVNRQRGSGTRAWFDRLLSTEGILPDEIIGYGVEEFTHQAVAAVIASGAADAGFGVRAVAQKFGLGFVLLGRETYYLVRHTDWVSATFDEIVTDLHSRVSKTIGYSGFSRQLTSRRTAPR